LHIPTKTKIFSCLLAWFVVDKGAFVEAVLQENELLSLFYQGVGGFAFSARVSSINQSLQFLSVVTTIPAIGTGV